MSAETVARETLATLAASYRHHPQWVEDLVASWSRGLRQHRVTLDLARAVAQGWLETTSHTEAPTLGQFIDAATAARTTTAATWEDEPACEDCGGRAVRTLVRRIPRGLVEGVAACDCARGRAYRERLRTPPLRPDPQWRATSLAVWTDLVDRWRGHPDTLGCAVTDAGTSIAEARRRAGWRPPSAPPEVRARLAAMRGARDVAEAIVGEDWRRRASGEREPGEDDDGARVPAWR